MCKCLLASGPPVESTLGDVGGASPRMERGVALTDTKQQRMETISAWAAGWNMWILKACGSAMIFGKRDQLAFGRTAFSIPSRFTLA